LNTKQNRLRKQVVLRTLRGNPARWAVDSRPCCGTAASRTTPGEEQTQRTRQM